MQRHIAGASSFHTLLRLLFFLAFELFLFGTAILFFLLRLFHFVFVRISVFQQPAQYIHPGVAAVLSAAARALVQVLAAGRAQPPAVLPAQVALGQLRQDVVGSKLIELYAPILGHQKGLIVFPVHLPHHGVAHGSVHGQLQRSQAAVAQHMQCKPVGAIECNYTGTVHRLGGHIYRRRK